MISSSEVGGCCRVQVARLPSDRPPPRTSPLPSLPPGFSPFDPLRDLQNFTTDAAPRISGGVGEGVRACKVVLPSKLAAAPRSFRNVGRRGREEFRKNFLYSQVHPVAVLQGIPECMP